MNPTFSSFTNQLKTRWQQGDFITRMLFLYVGIFLLLTLIGLIEKITGSTFSLQLLIIEWLGLSGSSISQLSKVYAWLTYQFLHLNFWHLLVNVLMLYFFGQLVYNQIGLKRFVPLYFLGGIFSAILYVGFSFILPDIYTNLPLIGASGSIMTIMAAAAILFPNYPLKFFLLFDIQLKWIVAAIAFFNCLALFNPAGFPSAFIHLSGLLFGVIYIGLSQRGIALEKPFNSLINFFLSFFNKKPKQVFVNTKENSSKETHVDYQDKIDQILDKINEHGYNSLSKTEKDFLFKNK